MSMQQLMAGYAEHYRRQALTPAQRAAEDKARADKQASARSELSAGWQDLYDTEGDKGVANYIIDNYKKGADGWKDTDLRHARQVQSGQGTFNELAKQDYDKAYADWNKFVSSHNSKIGPAQQTLRQMYPWENDGRKAALSNYDNFNFSGWVDPQIQIDKDNAAKAEAEKAAEARRRAEAAAAAKQQEDQKMSNTTDLKNQSVQNAFGGSNNQIDPGANKNREEAVERVQEYQKTNSNKAVNNTEKSSTSSTTSSNGSGYVQQLADNAISDYTEKWRNNQGSTTNYSNIFTNNIKQEVGNSGDWSTNFGNNNKLNNVRAGNDYSLNLGNINLKNNN